MSPFRGGQIRYQILGSWLWSISTKIGYDIASFSFSVGLCLLTEDLEYPSRNTIHLCPCTHTCQQEFCQQIQWCMDEAARTHLRDLQLIHIKQQERGVKSHQSFNSSTIFNLMVEKYCLSYCWTILWICSKLRPNMAFSSLMCFWEKYCISQNFIAFFFMNLLHWNIF